MESKQDRIAKESERKKICDTFILDEPDYVQNAYSCGLIDIYKLYVWYTVKIEIISDRKKKKILPRETKEAIKRAKKGEKRLAKKLGLSPIVVNVYKMNKAKRNIFIGNLEKKNLKSDLSPKLSVRMIYVYANINSVMDLLDTKELFYAFVMAYVAKEEFWEGILSEGNIVSSIKTYISNNQYEVDSLLGKSNTKRLMDIGKSSAYNYIKELKNKKTINDKKYIGAYRSLRNNTYIDASKKECYLFRIENVERKEDVNIVSYMYGGIGEVSENLRKNSLNSNDLKKDILRLLLKKSKRDRKIIVVDCAKIYGEKDLVKAIEYISMFKYNIYLKN